MHPINERLERDLGEAWEMDCLASGGASLGRIHDQVMSRLRGRGTDHLEQYDVVLIHGGVIDLMTGRPQIKSEEERMKWIDKLAGSLAKTVHSALLLIRPPGAVLVSQALPRRERRGEGEEARERIAQENLDVREFNVKVSQKLQIAGEIAGKVVFHVRHDVFWKDGVLDEELAWIDGLHLNAQGKDELAAECTAVIAMRVWRHIVTAEKAKERRALEGR